MIKISMQQWVAAIIQLPSIKESMSSERFICQVLIPQDKQPTIRTEYVQYKAEVEKRILSDVIQITFALSVTTAVPQWEPTEDILILSNKSK